jgi:hypothetical protein
MEIELNLKEIEEFVTSDNFIQFIINNTTQFGTAAFILQTLTEKLDEIRQENK